MHILRILAVLGRGDQAASEGMYEVLGEVMRKADTGINVGYAIGTYLQHEQYVLHSTFSPRLTACLSVFLLSLLILLSLTFHAIIVLA
jgi:hypothetical protein